jgi:hypothetical protein
MMPATRSTRSSRVAGIICVHSPTSMATRPVAVAAIAVLRLALRTFRMTSPGANETSPMTSVKMLTEFSSGGR